MHSDYFTSSPNPGKLHEVKLTVTAELAQQLAPSARITIWYLTTHGEIITDSLELIVEGAFMNDVRTNQYCVMAL